MTILITTAYLDEAERCNRLALLHNGRVLYCDTPAALKQRMPGTVVAISSASGREVRAAIAEREGVSNVILVGAGVHAVVDDAALRIPQLRNALQAGSIPFADIAVADPSIEDVFVSLLDNEGKSR